MVRSCISNESESGDLVKRIQTPFLLGVFLAMLAFGVMPEGRADDRQWPYYGQDDFELDGLRLCWYVNGGRAEARDGMLHLTAPTDKRAFVALKGLYQVSEPRIYLYWPWAMETKLVPSEEVPGKTIAFNAGIMINFGNDRAQGQSEFLGIASTTDTVAWQSMFEARLEKRDGITSFSYLIDGHVTDIEPPRGSEDSKAFHLRVEGVGEDGRTLRVGVKAGAEDPWNWSPEFQLAHPAVHASPMAVYNGPVTSAETTAAFDFIHFEGLSFDPGVFHRDDSEYLRSLTEEQIEATHAAGRSVHYIRDEVPKVKEPAPQGERTTARVPDTLDLVDRMKLSINAITECVDRGADFEPYCHVFVNPNGWSNASVQYNPDMERGAPVLLHDIHGYNTGIGEAWVESLPLLRLATGSSLNMEVSQGMIDNMRRMIGEDGLPQVPLDGRPWGCFTSWWVHDPLTGSSLDGDLTMTGEYAWGRFLSTLAVWHAATDSPALRVEIERMVDAFERLDRERPQMPQGMTTEFGLVQAYKFTGYEPAREAAARLLEKTRARKFQPDGSFSGHYHGTSFSVLSMAELAVLTGDDELMEFVKSSYEFAVSKGWPLIGFYPEGVNQDPPNGETCSFTHLPKIAILLSRAGKGDYWDDVDQLARNHMIECQLTESDWLYDLGKRIPNPILPSPAGYDGVRDVGRRLIGGFAAFTTLNDYFNLNILHAPGPIVGCCTGNGARSLYYVWRNILERTDDGLNVNLILNRASPWADVDSFLPYQGRVDVRMKADLPLRARMPGWVDLDQVTCAVGDEPRALSWEGRYASPGRVAAGQVARFDFPIDERTIQLQIGAVDATLVIRGATVVDITPKGRTFGLYQNRDHYRAGQIRWRTVERFVPGRTIDW